jgi:exodeoxyribonuclease V beta subunit
MIGFCAEDIRQFVEDENRLGDYEQHIEKFNEYNELWNTKGFFRMFRELLSDYSVRKNLLKLPDGDRRLTNVLHIAELIHRASAENRLGINSILSWIAEQRKAEEEKEEHELRLERDDEAVQILTVFKSKGLQYPIVFCPFMWQQGAVVDDDDFTFHESGSIYLDTGSPEWAGAHRALAGKENLSELVRLLYVAVTRAQNRCYITCGKIGRPAANAFDYLSMGGMDKDEDIVAALIKKVKDFSEDDVYREIKNYTEKFRGTICLTEPVTADPEPYQVAGDNKAEALSVRKFSGKINTDWGIASYSLLTLREGHGFSIHGSENIKRDEPTEQDLFSQSESALQKSFFSFPRGAVPGSCVHSIFEKLDFTDRNTSSQKKLIYNALKNYGLLEHGGEDMDKNQRVSDVCDMITKVLNAPLLPGNADFTLSEISAENRVSEMGFYYPLKRIVPGTLKNIFKKCAGMPDFQNTNFPEKIGDLKFSPIHGFMQGFIDLVFCFEGKYYLLDWKTNHLGISYMDYSRERLQISMEEAFYNLQYYIYTVALNKYLESRILDYNHERHFGGIFYLFVRGITPELPGNGIFFDLPSKEFVEELCTLCE